MDFHKTDYAKSTKKLKQTLLIEVRVKSQLQSWLCRGIAPASARILPVANKFHFKNNLSGARQSRGSRMLLKLGRYLPVQKNGRSRGNSS